MFQSTANNVISRRGVQVAALTALVCAFLLSCTTPDGPTANAGKPNTAASTPAPTATVDSGAAATEVYLRNCSICHRETGKGGKLILDGKSINPEDLTADKIRKMTDEKLIGYVTNGIEDEGMPAFKDKLSADEIKQTVAHIRTLQSP